MESVSESLELFGDYSGDSQDAHEHAITQTDRKKPINALLNAVSHTIRQSLSDSKSGGPYGLCRFERRPPALQNVCGCSHELNLIVPVEHNAEAHCGCVCLFETVESIFFRAISRTSFLGTHSSIVVSPLLGVWSYSFPETLR
jgi:hypothetical protein